MVFEISASYLEDNKMTPMYMNTQDIMQRLLNEASPQVNPEFINKAGILQMELVVTGPNVVSFVITDVLAAQAKDAEAVEIEYQRQLLENSTRYIIKANTLDELINISKILDVRFDAIAELSRKVTLVDSVAYKVNKLYYMCLENVTISYKDKLNLLAVLNEHLIEAKAINELEIAWYQEHGEVLVAKQAYQTLGKLA